MRKAVLIVLILLNGLFANYWLTRLGELNNALLCQTMALFSMAVMIILTIRLTDKK
jgi:hypothetical protein